MTPSRRRLLAGMPALLLLAAATPTRAQDSRPLRLVVGFPPGGPTDVVARLLAEGLREVLRQPVLVENRAGAAGNLAAEAVMRAPADGSTLLYASSSIAIAPALQDKPSFDARRDFAAVAETVSVPLVLLVHPQVPAQTFAEFVRHAKAHPGRLNYASSGNGTITHLAGALLAQAAGFQAQHVPYRGTAPALADLVGGTVQFTVGTINTALPFVREGRLRALAVTGRTRAASLPQVPTLDESGLKGFEASAWQGVLAPSGTPPAVVQQLSQAVARALARPELRSQLAQQDAEVRATTPDEFTAYLAGETQRWARVVRDTGAKAE